MMKFSSCSLLLALYLATTCPLLADYAHWTITGGTFEDGGTFSGTFDYDRDNAMAHGKILNWDITVSGGNEGTFPPFHYTPQNSTATAFCDGGCFVIMHEFYLEGDPNPHYRSMKMDFETTLTNSGGGPINFLLNGTEAHLSLECFECAPDRKISAGSVSGEIGVDTVAPQISNWVVLPAPLFINTQSTLTADVDDSLTGNNFVASVTYKIDTGSPSLMVLDPSLAVTTHASVTLPPFNETGVHTICLRATDAVANTTTAPGTCFELPVVDPSGGYVTGRGSVYSPAGADKVQLGADGPATFAFVSKYRRGEATPSGKLDFQFQQGDLTLTGVSTDWLVVTGQTRAQFSGMGVLNNGNICYYEVDAYDGSLGGQDAFGLRIFNCNVG